MSIHDGFVEPRVQSLCSIDVVVPGDNCADALHHRGLLNLALPLTMAIGN
jgi:hypothetical protein